MKDIGDEISWRSLNGIRTGVIVDILDTGYLVRQENGRCVIVNDCSMTLNNN